MNGCGRGGVRGLTGAICLTVMLASPAVLRAQRPAAEDSLLRTARDLAQELLIVDTHIDAPLRLHRGRADLSVRNEKGQFDFVRAREGGLDVVFMAVYIPSSLEGSPAAGLLADTLIDLITGLVRKHPDKFAVVTSTAQIRALQGSGKVLLAMGMENGAPIDGVLGNVRRFHARGIRYITLAHAKNNHLSDASYDRTRRWNGLSPFGREVVREMNRTGIMIDVSHLSDSAFYDVLRTSRAPVIASHSSCRHFTPGFERNMSDDMIRLLASRGGVIQINFGSEFLEPQSKTRPRSRANVQIVADHVDHAVKIAGVDAVGFGSDFDGAGDTMPDGLRDVAGYPALIAELMRRGYTRDDLRKICGENLLRVWAAVEAAAAGGDR